MENTQGFENKRGGDHSHIKGWGIDADPKNDPTYPMKQRTNDEHNGYTWERPPQQTVNVEVLHSIERPNITAVFGSTVPTKGLSGKIRRYAFKHSESSYAHWLPLLLADRVDMVEGLIEDINKGSFPNILAEKGIKAEWKHNKTGLLKRWAIGAVVAYAAFVYVTRRRS
ncbi:hypothetical protein [Arundinibacter roseus]|uniref:Uncharacterized protein n=1 Tax=Arundinibacter roseus TaxID=2070510 RepID=A0A4R4K0R3_9BACT|nr:hypothetical protein [Arundinibacter roseus]TDB60854.1 hypothetical protein EZE20_20640 [Arundinibacter roseus]